MMNLDIADIGRPDDELWALVGGRLHQYNIDRAGDDGAKQIALIVYDREKGRRIGGLIGEVHWKWFNVMLMFIDEEYRSRGLGRKLLREGEKKAVESGATHAYLDTFSFQNLEFYRKNGYEIFGELADFPEGHKRYFLRKSLAG